MCKPTRITNIIHHEQVIEFITTNVNIIYHSKKSIKKEPRWLYVILFLRDIAKKQTRIYVYSDVLID